MSYQGLNEPLPTFHRCIRWFLFNEASSSRWMSWIEWPKSAGFPWAEGQDITSFSILKCWERRKTNTEHDCGGKSWGAGRGTMRLYNFWWQLCYICIEVEMGWLQEGEDKFLCCPFVRGKSSSSSPASLVPVHCIIFSAVSWPPCQGCNDQSGSSIMHFWRRALRLTF